MLTLIRITKIVIIAFICFNAYVLVQSIFANKNKAVVLTKNVIQNALDSSNSSWFNEDKILGDLSKYGVMYILKDYNLEASTWIMIKGLVALVSGFIGLLIGVSLTSKVFLVISMMVIGFFIPDIFIRLSNEEDNKSMNIDILTIFTILKIHARAGVYITDSLIECQRSVTNKRLKQALNEMNNNILSSRVTIEEAVSQFNARFRNDQIDNLSIILIQATESGQSINLLDDLSVQIRNGNKIRTEAKKAALKRRLSFQQVLFFAMVTGMILYLVIAEMYLSLATM